ncbi:MAG: winged helix-turn-helix domain-containing protein [Acidobacteriota bacterium]
MGQEKFFFDDFEVDELTRSLLKCGQLLPLSPKAFDILFVLVEHHGEVLSKQNLLDLVWKDQFVEEKNLTVHVTALRKALGEKKGEHRFVVTVPGNGYKFVARLNGPAQNGHAVGDDEAAAADNEGHHYKRLVRRNAVHGIAAVLLLLVGFAIYYYSARTGETISSIAVLPLINVGSDPKTDFLSDGITENLIDGLSQSPNLKVIARSSVFRYKTDEERFARLDLRQVASELGVRAVLTGRVEQRGDDFLISVELVDGRDNTRLWGGHYSRKYVDILSVEGEIAADISTKLRLKLTGEREIAKRYTDNIKAFELYMMGRAYVHKRTREDLNIAKQYYEQAIKEDRNYALAYAGLAEVYDNLGVRGYISSNEGHVKFEESARQAIALDNDLAEGHLMLGSFYMSTPPFNFEKGQSEYRRAIELSPSLALAHLYMGLSLMRLGRLDDGAVEMQRALELDPFSAIINRQNALYYYLKRDPVKALEIIQNANQVGPPFITTGEMGIYIQNKLYDETLVEIDKAKLARKDDPLLIGGSGMINAGKGNRFEAIAAINELKRLAPGEPRFAHWIAKIYSLLGDKDNAFLSIEEGVKGGALFSFYKDEPVWDPIRDDKRFGELVTRMGIPQ